MSRHDDQVNLNDMLDHAREAVAMLGGRMREEMEENRMLQLALTRLIEIVGEAANRVSKEARQQFPELPWPQIIGMRNRLVHGYDLIDFDLLYDTVRTDLPPLIENLERILAQEL